MSSTPYKTKTPTIHDGTPTVKWSVPEATTSKRNNLHKSATKASTPGRVNLLHDFNYTPNVPSNVATPGVVRRFDTPHTKTQKLTYATIAASSNSTPTTTPRQQTPPTTAATQLFSSAIKSPISESSTSVSPSTSSIRSTSTTATSLAVKATASTDVLPETLSPSEYVVEFPPGPIHLKFDPVVYTLGKPMGCCISQIFPEFDTNLSCLRKDGVGSDGVVSKTINAGSAASIIQVNDLIVSINGTNVLSRKFDVINDLLRKLDGSHKTIVFRSIEKVWKSQFQRKTMRNLRSGKRVATALSTGEMERNLHSWVETPTKVEVGTVGDRRLHRGSDVISGENKLESIIETSSPSMSSSTMGMFSPSNVKKVMSQRNDELILSSTPNSVMEKRSNTRTPGKTPKKSPINEISKVLVGADNSEEEFELSIRQKKNVLKELNGVCLELAEKSFSGDASPELGVKVTLQEDDLASSDVNEVSRLEERVRELTSALATAEDEAREREDDLEERLQHLQNQLSSKKDTDAAHVEEMNRLKEEKEKAVNEVQQQLEKERASYQERVERGRKSKQELIGKLDATENELKKNKALFADLEKKSMSKKELRSKLQASKSLVQSLETEKGQITKQMKQLQQKLSERDAVEKEKQAELDALSLSLTDKAVELEKMTQQLRDSADKEKHSNLAEHIKNLQQELSERDVADKDKQAEVDSLSSSLAEKAVEMEKMLEELANLKQHLSQSEKKLSADKGAFKVNKSKLVEECEQLKVQLAASIVDNDDLHAQVEEHEKELSRRQTLLNDVKQRNYTLQGMIDELNQTLEKAGSDTSEQVDFLERKLQTTKQELEEARSTSAQHLLAMKQLQAEKRKIYGQLAKAAKEAEEGRVTLLEKEQISSENEFLDNRVGELTQSLAKSEAESREREEFLEKKLEIVKMELSDTKSTLTLRQDEIQRLKNEKQKILDDANSKYDDFKEQLSLKEDEIRSLNQQAEKERISLEKQLDAEKTLKLGMVQKLEDANAEHKLSLSRRQELLNDVERHNILLKQRVGELTDCLAQSEDDAREREDALEESLQQLGVDFEEAKMSHNQKYDTLQEEMKRVIEENEVALQELHQQMDDDRASFSERLEREDRAKAALVAELDASKDALVQSEASNVDLESRMEEVRKSMELKISELTNALEKAYDDAREREDCLQEELDQLGKEVDRAKSTIDHNSAAHEREVQRFEGEKRELLNENTTLHNQLDDLVNQIEMGENAKVDLQERVEALDRAKSMQDKSLSRRQELLDDMEARNKSLTQRVSELTDCLAKAEDEAREREDALEDKIQQVGVNFQEAKLAFNEEKAAHTQLVQRLEEEKEELSLRLSKFSNENVALNDQISVLESKQSDAETQLERLQTSNSELEDEVNELSEKVEDASQEAARNKALCADLKSKLEAAERLLDESDVEINTLSYDCDCLEKQIESLNAQVDNHEDVISSYKIQVESSRCEIESITKEKESLADDLESHMAKVLLLEDEKSDLAAMVASLQADINRIEEEKENLMSERDISKSTADKRLALLQQLEGKTEVRQSELLDTLAAKEFEISSLLSQREELKDNLEDLRCQCDKLKHQLKKDSESFNNRQEQLLDEISTINAQNKQYEMDIKSLETELERTRRQSKQEKDAHEKTERQLLMDIRNSQNTISGAKLKSTHVANEVQCLRSQLKARESDTSELVNEKERLAVELRTALEEVQIQVENHSKAESEHAIALEKLENDVAKEQALCAGLTSKLETLTSAMNAKQEELNRLKNELSSAKDSIHMLRSEDKMSKSTLESKLIDTRSQFEAERQSLQERISVLEADIRESQHNLLEQRTSAIEIEARLNSQNEISKAELSTKARLEEDLRGELDDINALLQEKNYLIEELHCDVSSEKEGRRQEVFEMKCLYEKKIQELTSSSLDIEAEKSILENKVEKLSQDIVASLEKESSLTRRIQEMETLIQSQNDELLKVKSHVSSTTAKHEDDLSEMEQTYTLNVKELKELHDTERNELRQQIAHISDELKLRQEEFNELRATREDDKHMLEEDKHLIDQLRDELEEGINLNASLSTTLKGRDETIDALRQQLNLKEESLTVIDNEYEAKINEMKSSHEAEKQHLVDEIAKFSMELEWSLDQIDKKQTIIDTQRLSLNDENNALVKELSKANDTEMKLRQMLHESQIEVSQLSMDFISMRGDIVLAIDEARGTSDETAHQAAQCVKAAASKWAAEKESYRDSIKTLSKEVQEMNTREKHLGSQVEELQSTLEARDKTVDELSSELTSVKENLKAASLESHHADDLASQLEALRSTLASRDQNISDLSSELSSMKDELCHASNETESVKDKLEQVTNELDEITSEKEKLQEEMRKLDDAKQLSQSLYETEKRDLQSEIDSLLANRSEKLISATSELDAMILANGKMQREISKLESEKQHCQQKFEADRVGLQMKIDSLETDLAAVQDELSQSRANIARAAEEKGTDIELSDLNIKNELLVDEVAKLKSDLQACRLSFESERDNYESEIASLSAELKCSSYRFEAEKNSFKAEWRHFQLLLKHLVDSIDGTTANADQSSSNDSDELPDIASQLGTLIELVGKKEESILQLKSQIDSLQFDLRDARTVRDRLLHHEQILDQTASPEEDLESSQFLSEIEEARVKVIGMDRRFASERSKRKDLESQLSAEMKSVVEVKNELLSKQSVIEELEESVQRKSVEIENLEARLRNSDDFCEKLEGKYEDVTSELESSKNLVAELKQMIIDKVRVSLNRYVCCASTFKHHLTILLFFHA